jgi:hypothetical protein
MCPLGPDINLDASSRFKNTHRESSLKEFIDSADDPSVCFNTLDYPTFSGQAPSWLE